VTAGEIPEEVAVAVGTAVGKPLAWRRGAPGGQTLARTWIVERSGGRTAFVKAAGSEHAVTEATRELLVYESVAGSFLPGIFGAAREGEWLVLILEDLGAAVWPPPYPDDPARLFDALRAVASAPAPDGLPRIPSRPEQHNWERVSQAPESVAALGACSLEWLEPALPDLAEAERRLDLSGDALVHNDVWHANLCFAVRGAVLVDWAAASVGDPRLDVAFALLSLRSSGRLPPAGRPPPGGRAGGLPRRARRLERRPAASAEPPGGRRPARGLDRRPARRASVGRGAPRPAATPLSCATGGSPRLP
jgi:hypothetical protein